MFFHCSVNRICSLFIGNSVYSPDKLTSFIMHRSTYEEYGILFIELIEIFKLERFIENKKDYWIQTV